MLIRIISSYVLVGLLVIAVITFVITAKVSADLTREINRSTDRAIEQSYNTANILLTSTYENYGTAFASADVQSGFYNEDFNTSALGRIGNKLYELSSTNPLIHSIYLFNYQKNLAFSSLTTYREFDDFYDPGALKMLDNMQPYRSGIFYPRHIEYEIYGKEYNRNLISLVYLSSIGRITNGAMVLNLDQQTLQSMVMNGAGNSSFQSMILNKQGTVISHTNSDMINRNLSDQGYVQQINASSNTRGTLELPAGGHNYRISYIKADSLGWIFIGVIDYESLLGKVKEMKRFILSVTVLMLLIVMVLGGFFTRLIYGPIHRLITNVRNSAFSTKDRQAISELDLLRGTFSYLENKIQDLQMNIADYHSAKRNEVLRLLTEGGWSNQTEIARKLHNVGIEFPHGCFVVSVLRLDSFRELRTTYKQSDIGLFKYAVSNIAVEIGTGRIHVVCFDSGEDSVALIANFPDHIQEAEQQLASILEEIQMNVSGFLKLSVSAAIGSIVGNMAEIKQSWDTAINASRYRLVLGAGSLIGLGMEATRESLQDSQVSLLEKLVIDRLKLGDDSKINEAVAEYIAYVRKAPFDEMMLVFTQLLIATARTAKAMADNEDSRMDIGALSEQLHQWETIAEIQMWYLGLCGKVIGLRDQQSQQKNKWIVDKIIQHIHGHYSDPNLTVESLVEVGGLSMNYMRRVFKDIAGQSITVYLSEYRFAKAKELLVETDLPANRIGEMVGFENTNYFYVSFKKHCGKTPDHYRKHHKFHVSEA